MLVYVKLFWKIQGNFVSKKNGNPDGWKVSAASFVMSLSLRTGSVAKTEQCFLWISEFPMQTVMISGRYLCVPPQPSAESMASLCLSQQRCLEASIASQWQLAEAQDQLCGLELHSSESVEQERARALASSAELSQTEQEWRYKERMLGRNPTLCPEASRDVFDKVSYINTLEKSCLFLQFTIHRAAVISALNSLV